MTQKSRDTGYFSSTMGDTPRKREAQNEFIKKLRISQLEQTYDMFTLG